MRYLSVCSGIEAATTAWHPLGWEPAAFSEVEAFPSAVLAHHYPNVPNLGDMTKFKEWNLEPIDLLVGGTPCQSFSVAGLRKGLDDPRGNLTLTFLAIADRFKPRFIVWENVPGILSDKTGALQAFLDGLEELGYIVDIDILDAQFFGLAQRRRRVFVCGEHRDHILKQTTISSELTILQCLAECLVSILADRSTLSAAALKNLGCVDSQSRTSLLRRMKLFGLDSEAGRALILENSLAAMRRSFGNEPSISGLVNGGNKQKSSETTKSPTSKNCQTVSIGECKNTDTSCKNILAEALQILSEFTTSTAKNEITESKIYTCSQAMLLIIKRITQLPSSSPAYWSAAQSTLIGTQEFTAYARQTTSDLFGDVQRFPAWIDFIGQAERSTESLRNIRVSNFGKVLPFSNSLCWHTPPRREAGQRIAACTAPSLTASGRGVERTGESRGQDPVIAVADTLRGHPRPGSNTTGAIVPATVGALTDGAHMGGGLTAKTPTQGGYSLLPETAGCLQERDAKGVDSDTKPGHLIPVQTGGGFDVAHSLKAEGFDASEDGTGRGTPLVPVAGAICKDSFSGGAGGRPEGAAAGHFVPCAIQAGATRSNPNSGPGGVGVRSDGLAYTLEARTEVQYIAFSAKDHGADAQLDLSQTLRAGGHSGSHANAGVMPAVAFESRFARNDRGAPSEVVPPLKAQSGETGKGDAAPLLLNAMQVRRLTPKETLRLQGFPDDYLDILYRGKPAADGPKYRAVGNSMATNVMRFIGERIQAVEAISQEQEAA